MVINYQELYEVIYRAFISLIVLFVVAKTIGKKQVSELSLFDYVIGISIGNFAAEITINLDADILYGVVGVIIFGITSYLVSILTMKSIKLRRFFMGTPTVLIDNGIIKLEGLKKVKFDLNDLLEECRCNGFFDINEIDYALMEANGTVSILPKSKYKPVTPNDLDIKVSDTGLCANVIIDGKLMVNNLKEIKKDEKWLLKQIKGNKIEDILLCTVNNKNEVQIYLKDSSKLINVLE